MVTQAIERRRAELGGFLKAHRARLSPADFGMPPGSRRRTPGLRREEVALLAGVGVTWYTWLEQGREINASQQVLDAVARTLRLSQAEREHMYRLAEATPLRAEDACSAIPEAIREIVLSLEPLPASLVNARYDLLLSNPAHEDLFWEWHTLPCIHKNTLWCCVTEPTARAKFPEYEPHVRYMVGRLRAAYSNHIGDKGWEEDIRRLSSLSSEFADLWARHEVASSQPRVITYLHPTAGTLRLASSELDVPELPEARITVYTPQDRDTRERLNSPAGTGTVTSDYEPRVPEDVDVSRPSVARIYDYLLFGKDNFAVDREAAQKLMESRLDPRRHALANRGFLVRAVQFLADAGIGQYLDLGSGLPTSPSVHEVARDGHPDARVVYVDIDPYKPGCAHDVLAQVRLPEANAGVRPGGQPPRCERQCSRAANLLCHSLKQFALHAVEDFGLVHLGAEARVELTCVCIGCFGHPFNSATSILDSERVQMPH